MNFEPFVWPSFIVFVYLFVYWQYDQLRFLLSTGKLEFCAFESIFYANLVSSNSLYCLSWKFLHICCDVNPFMRPRFHGLLSVEKQSFSSSHSTTMNAEFTRSELPTNFLSSSLAHVQECWRRTSERIGGIHKSRRSRSMPPLVSNGSSNTGRGFGSAFQRNPQTIKLKKAYSRSVASINRLSKSVHRREKS